MKPVKKFFPEMEVLNHGEKNTTSQKLTSGFESLEKAIIGAQKMWDESKPIKHYNQVRFLESGTRTIHVKKPFIIVEAWVVE